MAILTLTDATVWLDEFDATGHTNNVSLAGNADAPDKTTFGSGGWRESVGGLKSVEFSYSGFGDFDGATDDFDFANLAGTVVHTVSPDGEDGSVAYSFQGIKSAYRQTANIGDVFGIEGAAQNKGQGAIRGLVMLPKTTVTGNSNGTGVQIGDVAAGEKLYVAVHVFSAGTTADVIVESDNANTFGSATTRTTTTVTTTGGTWVTPVAGAITDDWWRVRTANVTGSFSIAVFVGIQ